MFLQRTLQLEACRKAYLLEILDVIVDKIMAGLHKRKLIATLVDYMDISNKASTTYTAIADERRQQYFEVHVFHALEVLVKEQLSSQSQKVSIMLLQRPPTCYGCCIHVIHPKA